MSTLPGINWFACLVSLAIGTGLGLFLSLQFTKDKK